jgi:hypothetical protein
MMHLAPRAPWSYVAGLSVAGVVAAHTASYALVHPDPHARAVTLHLSGHGYWDLAVAAAVVFGVASVLGRTTGAFLSSRTASGEPTSLRSLWARLALAQVGFFLVAEVVERILSGTLGAIVSEWAVWLGLPVLLAIALLGALVLRVAERAGVAIARRTRRPHSHATAVAYPVAMISAVRSTLLDRGRRTRAPPLPVAS